MAARIFCRTGELAGADFEIADDTVIGRSGAVTIVLPTQVVSQRHARISREPATGQYFLEDLGSRNGTRLDGVDVSRRTRLDELHVITFAHEHDFIFQCVDQAPARSEPAVADPPTHVGRGGPVPTLPPELSSPSNETRFERGASPRVPVGLEVAAEPARVSNETSFQPRHPLRMPDFGDVATGELAVRPVRLVLKVQEEGGGRRQVELKDGSYEVGRSPECHICLPDRTLSRRHARIDVSGDRVTMTDLKSENGTFLNGVRITEPAEVELDVEFRLGNYVRLLITRSAG